MKQDKKAFEEGYAQRSGLSLKELRVLGGYAAICDCGWEGCRGWEMMFSGSYGKAKRDQEAAVKR